MDLFNSMLIRAAKVGKEIQAGAYRRILSCLWILALGSLAVGIAYWPMVRQGYPYTHSIGSNALWAYQFGQQVMAGQLYPRWLEQSFASMGSPTFVFYPPGCMWAVVPFALLGWPVMDQLVGSVALALGVTAVGAWGYSRALLPARPWVQGICVALALLSPYFLINIHVRGAMGEMWAMGWLLWILWGTQIRLAGPQAWRLLPLTGAIMMLGLSHLPTLLLFFLMWLPLPVLLLEIHPFKPLAILKQLGRNLWELYLPLGLGLGLASFFLLPPIFDQPLINISYIKIATPLERLLVDGILQFSPTLTEHDFDRQLLPSFGIALGTIGVVIGVGILTNRFKPWKTQVKLLGWATLFSLIMVTDLGKFLYEGIGSLERIQFSWRWLAISSVCWPFLWGLLLVAVEIPQRLWLRWSLRGIHGIVIVAILVWTTGSVWQATYPWPFKVDQLNQFFQDRPPFPEEVDLTARPYQTVDFGLLRNRWEEPFITDVYEYTPSWISHPNYLPPRTYELVEWGEGQGQIQELEWRVGWRRFRVHALQAGLLWLRMYSWPGWQVRVNDGIHSGMAHSEDGRLQIPVPEGESWVEVRYGGSRAEQWGWGISGATLMAIGVLLRAYGRITPRI